MSANRRRVRSAAPKVPTASPHIREAHWLPDKSLRRCTGLSARWRDDTLAHFGRRWRCVRRPGGVPPSVRWMYTICAARARAAANHASPIVLEPPRPRLDPSPGVGETRYGIAIRRAIPPGRERSRAVGQFHRGSGGAGAWYRSPAVSRSPRSRRADGPAAAREQQRHNTGSRANAPHRVGLRGAKLSTPGPRRPDIRRYLYLEPWRRPGMCGP
jgi:hypothetical protein